MAITPKEALDIIYAKAKSNDTITVTLEESLGKICYEEIKASIPLPRFANSAMDGFAIRAKDAGKRLPIQESVYAGSSEATTLQEGHAIRIMTGAPAPLGCDTIVPIEACEVEDGFVMLPSNIDKGKFLRLEGEDIAKGEILLQKGDKITAYAVALLASQGITHLKVYRPLRVAILATGNELKPIYETLGEGELYNTNTPMLLARVKELGCEAVAIQSSADALDALQSAIKSALKYDLIITTGGISKGEKDLTLKAFEAMGLELFYGGVTIKPGYPSAFGKVGDTYIFNLPGNPLAAMVNFELFTKTLIATLQGDSRRYHLGIECISESDIGAKPGITTIKLGSFDGKVFRILEKQKPGMLHPLYQADSFAVVEKEVKKSETIIVYPLYCPLKKKRGKF